MAVEKASLFTVDEYKKNFKKNTKVKEDKVQMAFCKHVKKTFPDVIFNCDLASGMNLGKHIGGMNSQMRSSRAHCDFHASEPRGDFKGFYLELKRDRDEVYRKDGGLKSAIKTNKKTGEKYDHIKEQWEMIQNLRSKGYYADFGLGLDDCIDKMKEYMSLPKNY